ncbi:MAG: hypothetical protein ACD_77C00346G0023 [uncultured bacterium]|nr:MAG: hypothetical protein ACD_77C00346G0023 [uncultured bacterium]
MDKDKKTNIQEESSGKNIIIAFILNLSFALIELVGAIFTNSVAILSDAVHDLGDSLSLGVAYYLQKKSRKGGDRFYSYGYLRFSLLGSVFISTVLLISSFYIIKESIDRIISPQEAYAPGMLILAVFGVLVNGAAFLKLRKGKSQNEKAVTIHMMEDVLGWSAVLVASIFMIFIEIPVLDPILSLSISFWVLFNVYRNLKETFRIMLQEVPKGIDVTFVERELLKIDGIKSVHDLHIWTLDGEKHVMTVHAVSDINLDYNVIENIKSDIRKSVKKQNIGHITIEIESEDEAGKCLYNGSC